MQFAANRLSRFVYDATSPEATSESEEILITTTEKQSSVHSAGWVGFAPSSFANPSVSCLRRFAVNAGRVRCVGGGGKEECVNGQDFVVGGICEWEGRDL